MATREIKDAKDLTTNELIYFKGHAKATYMSNGWTVEDAINNINVGEGSTCTIVNHNASDVSVTIQPNTFHIWGVLSENKYSFDTHTRSDENMMIQFTIGNTIPTLVFTDGLIWNTEPTFSANTVYQISITGSLAIVTSFDAIFNMTCSATALPGGSQVLYGQTWGEWIYSDSNTRGLKLIVKVM